MQLFGLLCVGAYCVMAWLVGVKLLRLAARTGETPELFLGSALMLGGAVGYPATVAAAVLAPAAPAWALRAIAAGTLGLTLSAWAILVTWNLIYHRGEAWARWVVVAVTALLFLALVDRVAALDPARLVASGATVSIGYLLLLAAHAIPYALTAGSGFRYHALLRRRIPLGLADPVAANAIRLWSFASLAVVTQYVLSVGVAVARRRGLLDGDAHVVTALTATLGLTIAVLLALAFFPPKAYARRVAASSLPGARRGGAS